MKQRKGQNLDKRIQRGKKELLKRIRKAKKRFDKTQKRWVDHMLQSKKKIDGKITSLAREIVSMKSDISNLECRLESAQRDLKSKEEEFHSWKEVLKNSKKGIPDYKEKLKKLTKLPHILAVEIVHNSLRVYTDTISITHNSKQYEIGAFEITLNLAFDFIERVYNITDSLTFKNVTNTTTIGRAHPYVFEGWFCFGDLEWDIETALRQHDFVLAFIHILQALQNGEGDLSYLVENWTEVANGI